MRLVDGMNFKVSDSEDKQHAPHMLVSVLAIMVA
jgi:hypothetical protein